MNSGIFTFIIIPVIVFVTFMLARFIRRKVYKPKYEDNVQKPGRLERAIVVFLMFLDFFVIVGALAGVLMEETEMTLVFGILALILFTCIIILQRAHNTSYQENYEYFILKSNNKEYQVFYENIIDWQPAYNEISVLDASRTDGKYIRVNIKMFKPEILLRKITDMAFDEKFKGPNADDPYKKAETVYYIANNGYGYLVDDYLERIENKY